VCPHRRMVHVIDEAYHALDIVEQRQVKRLQLQGDLHTEIGRVIAEHLQVADSRLPLLLRRNHFLLPDVLTQNEQQVLRLVLIDQVEILLAPVNVKPLNTRIEVDEADGDAGDAYDGQAGRVTLALDEPAFLDVDVERIGKDVDGIKADLFCHPD